MRVFAFLLMMLVGVGGTLAGYRLITGKDLVTFAEFGLGQPARQSVAVASPVASATPTSAPTRPPATSTPPPATPTPAPDKLETMAVGNTDGQGVYLRRSPRMEDKLRAWNDGAIVEILGPSQDSEGRKWRKVRTPDGVEGYMPEQFLVEPKPAATPGATPTKTIRD